MSGKSSEEERIPRFADIEGEMLAILRPPDSRRILFLDTKGQWSGNPQGLRDRIS